jgi:transposase
VWYIVVDKIKKQHTPHMKYHISEKDWQVIYAFLKTIPKIHIKDEYKTRLFVEAVYFLMRTGIQTRMLPDYYGNCYSIYQRFLDWKNKGIWEGLFKYLQKNNGKQYMIDSTTIRANQCAAGYKKNSQEEECLGRSRGGYGTKVHVITDEDGNPIEFILTPGNKHDITQAEVLTKNIKDTTIIADKRYDSHDFEEFLHKNNCEVVIPSRKTNRAQRNIDMNIYKLRHFIENFFSKTKCFRRICTRFDKTASSYITWWYFASSIILLR